MAARYTLTETYDKRTLTLPQGRPRFVTLPRRRMDHSEGTARVTLPVHVSVFGKTDLRAHPGAQRGHLPRRRPEHRQCEPPSRSPPPRGRAARLALHGGRRHGRRGRGRARQRHGRRPHLPPPRHRLGHRRRRLGRSIRLPHEGSGRAGQPADLRLRPGASRGPRHGNHRHRRRRHTAKISTWRRSATAGPTWCGTARPSSSPRTSR